MVFRVICDSTPIVGAEFPSIVTFCEAITEGGRALGYKEHSPHDIIPFFV